MAYDPVLHGAHCHRCPLRKEKSPDAVVIPPVTNPSPKLIVVGEGPGRNEEKLGVPFVGMSGKLLFGELAANGIVRSDCHVTNAALCRGESDKDNEAAARCCAPRLLRELASLPPQAPILTLGKTAMVSVLGSKKISYGRGFVWTAPEIDNGHVKAAARAALRVDGDKRAIAELKAESLLWRAKLAGRSIFPTLHPAFILRADTWKAIFQLDLNRVARHLRAPLKLEDAGSYTVTRGAPRKEIARMLRRLGPQVAYDIETDGVKPLETKMLCIGFSDGEDTVVIWPWKKSYASTVSKFLRTRRVAFGHNSSQFDDVVMAQHGIDFSRVARGDTLIAHHSYLSHFPQRLDQLASEYCDAAPWKIRFGRRGAEEKGALPKDMPPDELCLYNAADARLTAKVWRRMQQNLSAERHVYEHDMALADVCRDMMVTGIGIDYERKERISSHLKGRIGALKGAMRRLLKWEDFSPSSVGDVRRALFRRLRVRKFGAVTSTGLPSTSNTTLEMLKGDDTRAGKFAGLLLDYRVALKIRSTYVGGTREKPLRFDEDWINPTTKRAHYGWKPFGTVSGRLAGRLMSCPRHDPTDPIGMVREMYMAARGHKYVYHDVAQAEAKFAAWMSGDPTFMAACASDIHAGNAATVFPEIAAKGWLSKDPACRKCKGGDDKAVCSCPVKDPKRGKPYRDIAKNLIFAISYGAGAEKLYVTLLSQGFTTVSLRACELMLVRLQSAYRKYYMWAAENLRKVKEVGYMRTEILGRIRWLGWFPSPPDVYNYPIQSALADVMNLRMIAAAGRLPAGWRPDICERVGLSAARPLPKCAKLVAQVHDACIYEVPNEAAADVAGLIAEAWKAPIQLAGGPLVLSIDQKIGERWSEL